MSPSTTTVTTTASFASSVEVGSTMKLANVSVWFFLRRQDVKVRRFMSLVLGVALILLCWQLTAFQKNHNNNNTATTASAVMKTATPTTTTTTTTTASDKTSTMTTISTPKQQTNVERVNDESENDSSSSSSTSSDGSSTATSSSNTDKKENQRSSPSLSSVKFVLSDEEEFLPKIVWLMSWPNSGTSFTLTGVERLTNKSIATNYGDEVTPKGEYSLGIYPLRIEGPYWKGMDTNSENKASSKGRPLPEDFVLTKTHCGSRCSDCGPKVYLETRESFLKACGSGHGRFPPRRQRHLVHYTPLGRVHRAIQLIRNPFHNVVARFHLDRRNKARKPSRYGAWVKAHPDTVEGFSKWCQDMDKEYQEQDEEVFDPSVLKVLRLIPCRAEFYMYIQWHNLVHEAMALLKSQQREQQQQQQREQQQQQQNDDEDGPEFPLLTIYYEDYGKNLNGTFNKILDFVQLQAVGKLPSFTPRDNSYQDYYTNEQRASVQTFLRHMASNRTWEQIKHYF